MTTRPARDLRPVAMLTHSYYEEDARVRREAETLVERGRPVDVFSLRRPGDQPEVEIEGVRVRRLNVQRHQGAGVGTYLAEYVDFFVRAAWAASLAHRTRRYALLQVHSLPDFLAFAGLPLRLYRVPLLLDLHEAMPEFFRERFPRAANPVAHWALELQERLATAFASHVLTVNEALADRLVERGVPEGKVSVILNSPHLTLFDPAPRPTRPFLADGRLRLVYGGALTPTYELDVVLAAIGELRRRRPGLPVELDLYGRGDFAEPLQDQASQLGIAEVVRFHGRIPLEEMPAAIAAADIGLAPTRRTRFTDFSLSAKIFEYAAMGKPVVASHLPSVVRYFGEDSIVTYESGDPVAMAEAILRLVDHPTDRDARLGRTAERVREHSWEREGERYVEIVERLALDGGARSSEAASAKSWAPAGEER